MTESQPGPYLEFVGPPGQKILLTDYPVPNPSHYVVCVPPFAEEMNRSRPMIHRQARAFQIAGVGVLVVDLFGTGDSEGDFTDASWERWHKDLETATGWLQSRHNIAHWVFWGIRLGGLLAVEYARQDSGCDRLLLWQPVVDGQIFLNQFLRLRQASNLIGGGPKESTNDLKQQLANGDSLEIAGYELSGPLAVSLEKVSLKSLKPRPSQRVAWFELGMRDAGNLAINSSNVTTAWDAAGLEVCAEYLSGEPFWGIQEITLAPAIIDRSTRWLCFND